MKDDLAELIEELKHNPNLGTDLGNGLHKVRMAMPPKEKEKAMEPG